MTLTTVWFVIIAVLWAGFFVLEGFDLGVGMLHRAVAADERERRAAISTIAPVWDGNEVWLIVAGAGMFAAFPSWYATTFSALYLAVVLLLAALIVRGVSFEFGAKVRSARWRSVWSWSSVVGSALIPLLLGITLGAFLAGLPINSSEEYTGSFADLFTPYGVFFGVALVVVCLVHGAVFLALRSTGPVRARATRFATWSALPMALVVTAAAIWTHVLAGKGVLPNLLEIIAILTAFGAAWLCADRMHGWAFLATATTMAAMVLSLFADLYPHVMISSLDAQYSLTVTNSASGSYALKLMTVIVAVFLPIVLLYQGWTYHVFRARIHVEPVGISAGTPGPPSPNGGSVHAADRRTE
jgi:cytochrome d ubiquinol oxidase subunit II